MPGSIIAPILLGAGASAAALAVTAFAINLVASQIIARAFAPDMKGLDQGQGQNPGNRQQVGPAGSNKLPVVYGSSFVGGTITDLTISNDNQTLYYCLALSEVTNTQGGAGGDAFTFGNVYWGGKRCVFDSTDQTRVVSLLDESTGESQTNVDGNLFIYLYRNGSYQPTNSTTSAITVMSASDLAYAWDSSKLMSNCAFAIVKMVYNSDAGLTGIQQTRFQVNNPRTAPGDCFSDFLQSTRYGAGIPASQIDATSLAALNAYCAGAFTYTPSSGGSSTITRFKFDGVLDTTNTVMTNMQGMAASCDCLLRYNELTAKWGVIVQSPTYTVAMAINDSNMVSALQINPTDLSSTPNIIESKFANGSEKDTFASAVFSLAQVAPSLLYPNEPVNKQSVTLPLTNSDVRAQYIAQRLLKAGREDLIVKVTVSFVGLQLEAGDIVTLTSANYGWTNKLFRISQVTENFSDDGQITASLTLLEYNPTVYDDVPITQFAPAPNTGIPSPLVFGTLTAPVVVSSSPNAVAPSITVNVTTATTGIVQYVELWYSAFPTASSSQMIFAGTTAIQSNGLPYAPGTILPVTLTNIAAGNWYFYGRMVNQLGTSNFTPPSALLQWRPTTFAYAQRYLIVAYADSITGSGINSNPSGKSFYGLLNSNSTSYSTTASDYTWFAASPTFGTTNKLCYINRTGRLFSFGIAPATYAAGSAAYVPASTFDDTIWSALPDGQNWIDLDLRTGQLTRTGTTSTGGGQLSIVNNSNGTLVGQLQSFLTFPGGNSTFTGNAANLTIDIYGRVVGLIAPDEFYYTSYEVAATAGQTVFTPTARQAGYITGQDLVFRDGVLLDTSEYSETNTTVTLNDACVAGEYVTIISFRSVNSSAIYYESLGMLYLSGSGTTVCTYNNLPYQTIAAGDKLTFSNSGTPTQYTVSSVDYNTKQITFSGNFTSTAGAPIYRARAVSATYPSFSRWTVSISSASLLIPTTFQLVSGYELIFLNGTIVNDQDYDLIGGEITNFPDVATGNLTIIQFASNNLGVANGSPAIVSTNTVNGQDAYPFTYNPDSFELYNTGVLQVAGVDYTTPSGGFVLSTTPTYNTNVLSQQTFNRNGAA
jgi:hypothetical protein